MRPEYTTWIRLVQETSKNEYIFLFIESDVVIKYFVYEISKYVSNATKLKISRTQVLCSGIER